METDFFANLERVIPRRTEKIYMDPNRALNTGIIRPAGFFQSQQEIENNYIIVPLSFAQSLFGYKNELSALEIKTDLPSTSVKVQHILQQVAGDSLVVKNRIQQNELLYKTMKSEKWAISYPGFYSYCLPRSMLLGL
jgi:hypothetical protein